MVNSEKAARATILRLFFGYRNDTEVYAKQDKEKALEAIMRVG